MQGQHIKHLCMNELELHTGAYSASTATKEATGQGPAERKRTARCKAHCKARSGGIAKHVFYVLLFGAKEDDDNGEGA
jgi:hypothetical protein